MMRLVALVWLLLALFTFPASSSGFYGTGLGDGYFGSVKKSGGSPPPSFTGIADLAPTIGECWSLRACSSTVAAAQGNAVDLSNNVTTCTAVKVKTNGDLDTTVGHYCNGNTQTVTAWCSTNCIAGGSARIVKKYGQINGLNMTAASYAVGENFILSGAKGKPTGQCINANGTYISATTSVIAQPFSIGTFFERTGSFTGAFLYYVSSDSGSGAAILSLDTVNGVQAQNDGAGTITGTATDGTGTTDFGHFHSALFTSAAGGGANASFLYIDGGSTPGTIASFGGIDSSPGECAAGGTETSDAFVNETWIDATQESAGNASAISANQAAYW